MTNSNLADKIKSSLFMKFAVLYIFISNFRPPLVVLNIPHSTKLVYKWVTYLSLFTGGLVLGFSTLLENSLLFRSGILQIGVTDSGQAVDSFKKVSLLLTHQCLSFFHCNFSENMINCVTNWWKEINHS